MVLATIVDYAIYEIYSVDYEKMKAKNGKIVQYITVLQKWDYKQRCMPPYNAVQYVSFYGVKWQCVYTAPRSKQCAGTGRLQFYIFSIMHIFACLYPFRRTIIFSVFCQMLLCFSLYTNGLKILDMSKKGGQLECLHGMRVLSMFWVILGHTYLRIQFVGKQIFFKWEIYLKYANVSIIQTIHRCITSSGMLSAWIRKLCIAYLLYTAFYRLQIT